VNIRHVDISKYLNLKINSDVASTGGTKLLIIVLKVTMVGYASSTGHTMTKNNDCMVANRPTRVTISTNCLNCKLIPQL